MFPQDADTISLLVGSNGTTTLLNIPSGKVYTILGITLDKTGGSGEDLISDSSGNVLAHKDDAGSLFQLIQKEVNSNILFRITSGVSADHFAQITYIPRAISSSTAPIARVLTYGDIFIGTILMMSLVLALYSFIFFSIHRQRVNFRKV
jgi:hypothetical protein